MPVEPRRAALAPPKWSAEPEGRALRDALVAAKRTDQPLSAAYTGRTTALRRFDTSDVDTFAEMLGPDIRP